MKPNRTALTKPVFAVLVVLIVLFSPEQIRSQPADDSARDMAGMGLTLYELDREIERLAAEERRLLQAIASAVVENQKASVQVVQQRQKTENLLRAYYMGERTSIWLAFLRVRSIPDAIYVWDQLHMILEKDRRMLDAFKTAYNEWKRTRAQLEADRRLVMETKASFEQERVNRASMAGEIERRLAASANRSELEQNMETVRIQWEDKGLPLFRRYFTALSEAMAHLPDLLGQNGSSFSLKGARPTLKIADKELNRFLQEQSDDLSGFSFQFDNNAITAGGVADGSSISLSGRYVVEQQPVNAVRFVIDRIDYNGFEMPSSTAAMLEREYDLAFYPNRIVPFVQASDVQIANGWMTVVLKLTL